MRLATCLLSALFATLPALACAAQDSTLVPQAGDWAITTQLGAEQLAILKSLDAETLNALSQHQLSYDLNAGTMTAQRCLNKSNLAGWNPGEKELPSSAECAAPKISSKGNVLSVSYQCTQPAGLQLNSRYEFSAARDSYTFVHELSGNGEPTRIQGKARRSGDC
ncbi:DUF3617 domain-containing protein [Chitinilyticum piscinae]|nr:DUF3617 family protein [Chitinilyticum piscinae]